MDLAQQLAEGVQALRDGRPEEAATLLEQVARDPDFVAAEDLRDVRARALSLWAQALLESDRASQARVPVQDALELLEALGDEHGLTEVRALQTRIGEAISAAFQRAARSRELKALAERPLADVLAGVTDPARRLDLHVRRTTAALEAGRPDEAAALARDAIARASELEDVRHGVLARIALAQASAPEADEALSAARDLADDANEPNLVAAVARAAEELGITLPSPEPPCA